MKQEIDEAAVWQRVTSASQCGPAEASAERGAALLTEAIQAGTTLAQVYNSLCRGGKAAFRPMLEGQRRENRLLLGLYIRNGGLPSGEKCSEKTRHASYVNFLRWILEQQEAQLRRLEALAGDWGAPGAGLLRQLSCQAEERWGWLIEALGRAT